MASTDYFKKLIVGWGIPQNLQRDLLPTYEDLADYYFFLEQKSEPTLSKKEIFHVLCNEVSSIWLDAGAHPIGAFGVRRLMKNLIKNINSFKKTLVWRRSKSRLPNLKNLFDIGSCKCLRGRDFKKSLQVSQCLRDANLSSEVVEFILDQRGPRHMRLVDGYFLDVGHTIHIPTAEELINQIHTNHQMFMDDQGVSNDEENTSVLSNVVRDACEDAFEMQNCDADSHQSNHKSDLEDELNDGNQDHQVSAEESDDSESEYFPFDEEITKKNFLSYPNLYLTASRYGLSNRATAALANALLKDLNLPTCTNASDPKKIQRGKTDVGRRLDQNLKQRLLKNVQVIAFDERKDTTMMRVRKESEILRSSHASTSSSVWQSTSKQEHCAILGFGKVEIHGREGTYLTHVSPPEGSPECLAQEIFKIIQSFECEDSVIGVLADGCSKHTGVHAGVIRKLEERLERPLAHLVCLYHCNELPYRRFFEFLDGGTRGPSTLSGEIGHQIEEDLTTFPIVNFKRVRGQVERPDKCLISRLSNDQRYLLEISLAVMQGPSAFEDNPVLARRSPGALIHTCWLTKANRILRLYVSSPNPSLSLQRLVYLTVNCYSNAWFQMKKNDCF